VKMEDEQLLSVPESVAGARQMLDHNMLIVGQADVGSFAGSRKHHRKRSHDGLTSAVSLPH